MSAPHLVDANGREYLVVDDVTSTYQALLAGSVGDEVTGDALPPAAVLVDRPDLIARVVDGGFFVISGYLERLFLPVTIQVTLTIPGYGLRSLPFTIAANVALPVDAGSVTMRPAPVRIQGRVVRNNVARTPISGATVAAVTAGVLALRTPLHFAHAAGTVVRERVLTPAGPALSLIADAAGRSGSILVSNTAGLAPGAVVRLGSDVDAEYAVISAFGQAAGEVLLTAPLVRTFRAADVVQPVSPGAAGTSTTLTRFADAGDGLLLTGASLAGATCEVADGAVTEYNTANALTDAEGFYRLDGMGGVRTLDLTASAPGFADLTTAWSLDYKQPVNVVSFRLST